MLLRGLMLLRKARLRSEQAPARAFDARRRGIERSPAGRGRGRRRGLGPRGR